MTLPICLVKLGTQIPQVTAVSFGKYNYELKDYRMHMAKNPTDQFL